MPERIGILSFHWAPHAGAYLQTYALYNILKSLSFEVIVINFLPRLYAIVKPPSINPKDLFIKHYYITDQKRKPRIIVRSIIGEMLAYLPYFGAQRRMKLVYEDCLRFLNLSEPVLSLDELRDIAEDFDAIVVGSDQVWNPTYLRDADYAYLLPFQLSSVRKIAYAASFGIDDLNNISSNLLTKYIRCLKDFDNISVREQSHIPWLSKLIGRKVMHALDPTLLLSKKWWNTKVRSLNIISLNDDDNYTFVYNLTYSLIITLEPLLNKLKKKGFSIFAYRMPKPFPLKQGVGSIGHFVKLRKKVGVVFLEYVSPFELLWLIKNARYVITNSYHGTIFSILFEKKFVVIPPYGKSIRILDLLNLLRLEHRTIYTTHSLDDAMQKLEEEIDYGLVKKELEFHRRRSLNFLLTSIQGD